VRSPAFSPACAARRPPRAYLNGRTQRAQQLHGSVVAPVTHDVETRRRFLSGPGRLDPGTHLRENSASRSTKRKPNRSTEVTRKCVIRQKPIVSSFRCVSPLPSATGSRRRGKRETSPSPALSAGRHSSEQLTSWNGRSRSRVPKSSGSRSFSATTSSLRHRGGALPLARLRGR
jgi:hypothetical protein